MRKGGSEMDDATWFTIHRPDPAVALPIIIHVPHASRFVPMHCHGDFVLTEAELREVIEALVDHDTDRLALPLVALGAHVVINNVCNVKAKSVVVPQSVTWTPTKHETKSVNKMLIQHLSVD